MKKYRNLLKNVFLIVIIILLMCISFDPVVGNIPSRLDRKYILNHSFTGVKESTKILKGSIQSCNDLIIDIIEQMNKTLYLGYLENLTAFGPRVTGTNACHEAGDYIYNEFENMDLDSRYHYWEYGGYSDRNIEATLLGVDGTSDEIFIICGHYDTVANCPGADDDASGVATVLSAANILRNYGFNHTIRFIAFSGEEQWMLGSHEYAREAYENGENIIAVLNVDMIGYAITPYQGSNIKIFKNEASKWISDFTLNVSEEFYEYIFLDVIPLGESPSDQLYFWEYGYDGVFYHEYEFNEYYHTPQDIIENMNITYATKFSKLILATLALLAQPGEVNLPPKAPTISGPSNGKPGTEYTYSFNSLDPNDHDVSYYILWGDGHVELWDGPHPSGSNIEIAHNYNKEGAFTIQAKAKDIFNSESNWSYFEVEIPRTRASSYHWFLERFPLLDRLLGLIR
ncbi:MAG: hypothetical protein AYK22_05515 [Thermoplasmatales archaeon SG8-52-3]|nr:MAG: hypothetical protein AYK22_05515 [Thermoplasmatales archaeon SG8-52-3]